MFQKRHGKTRITLRRSRFLPEHRPTIAICHDIANTVTMAMIDDAVLVTWATGLLAGGQCGRGVPIGWRKVRDLSVLPLGAGVSLVFACDALGGIGPKPHDTYRTDGYTLGRFAARVPLAELLACGATPLLVANMLSVERDPTGMAILAGVRDEAATAGLDPDAITGSTEENVPTLATGVGIAVLGLVAAGQFRPGRGRVGDLMVCIGVPKSAPRDTVTLDDPDILDLPALLRLLSSHANMDTNTVGDVLPVGSRGIRAEADDLAASAGLRFVPDLATPRDLVYSGGPATCALATVTPAVLPILRALRLPPLTVIGTLVAGD